MTKLKAFSGKVRQSVQNYLNENLYIGSFLQKYFEGILTSKTSVLSISKEHFSGFWKFLSDEVEIIFWESDTERSKLFKSQFVYRKLLRK